MQVRRINAAYPSFLDWTRFAEDASGSMLDRINVDRQIADECISMYDSTISPPQGAEEAGSSAAAAAADVIAAGGLEHDLGAQVDILRWKKKKMDSMCSSDAC